MLLDLIDPDQPALVAVIGPPGAGKSTFARAYSASLRGLPVVLSLDAFRAEASRYNDPSDQSVTRQAVRELHATLAAYLSEGRTVVVDATNAERPHRLDLLRLAEPYDALTAAVVILPDLAECLARNAARDGSAGSSGFARRVPDDVIELMHREIEADLPHLPAEGWQVVIPYQLPNR